ncbi:MAG: hypothetical protein ABSE79_18500 [Terriglobia bacterium]|jgi:hypothetical protein
MKVASKRKGKAGRRAGVGLGFCLALAMFPFTLAFAGAQPDAKITVRVYNYAHVPSGALAGAETEARRILTAAGVDSLWLDCFGPRGQFRSEANEGCAGLLGGRVLAVRILPGTTLAKAAFHDTVFGFAEGTAVASVFYGRITDFAYGVDGQDWEIPLILGDAMTHELGHLLLGSGSHSPTGIMCGQWDRDYLRLALMGRQLFTPQQSALLQVNVLLRNGE